MSQNGAIVGAGRVNVEPVLAAGFLWSPAFLPSPEKAEGENDAPLIYFLGGGRRGGKGGKGGGRCETERDVSEGDFRGSDPEGCQGLFAMKCSPI